MVVRGSVLLGTAKTLIAMVADYSTEIVVERERKEGGVHGGIGGRCGIFIMYVCGSGSGGREAAAAAAARVNDSVS